MAKQPAEDTMISIGVVGFGYMGRKHAQVVSQLPGVRLTGIADASPKARWAALAVYPDVGVFENAAELAAHVDLAIIATPVESHLGTLRPFIEAGIRVLVEKPITHTGAEWDELCRLLRGREHLLFPGFIELFNPAFQAVGAMVQSSSVRAITALRSKPQERVTGRPNVTADFLIHDLYCCTAMFGAESRVEQVAAVRGLDGVIDHVTANLMMTEGAQVTLEASRVLGRSGREWSIVAGDAHVYLDFASQSVIASGCGAEGSADISVVKGSALEAELVSFIGPRRAGNVVRTWDIMERAMRLFFEIEENAKA